MIIRIEEPDLVNKYSIEKGPNAMWTCQIKVNGYEQRLSSLTSTACRDISENISKYMKGTISTFDINL